MTDKSLGRMEKGIETLEKACTNLEESLRENTRNTIQLTQSVQTMAKIYDKHIEQYDTFRDGTNGRLSTLEGDKKTAMGFAAGAGLAAGGASGGLIMMLAKLFGGNN